VAQEIGETTESIRQAHNEISRLGSLNTKLEKLKKKNEKYLLMVPHRDEPDRLVQTINETAKEKGLVYRRRSELKQGKPSKGYIPVTVSYDFSGTYHDFGQFVQEVETGIERLVTVTEFKVTGNNDGLVPGAGGLKIHIEFLAYRYAGN
jgi:Tfp pilus assembly protein PilO